MMDPATVRTMQNTAVMAAVIDIIVSTVKEISTSDISNTLNGDTITSQTLATLAMARLNDCLEVKRGLRV